MAFLDNSGDIILDAVLTDAGRARLASGDGSFKISKFAFADDEINYAKYDKTNTNGSAYYAIDILSTPVFEAFTNNASSMKSKLVSIARTNLLYLPVVLINETDGEPLNQLTTQAANSFAVLVDETTDDVFEALSSDSRQGVFFAVKNTNKSNIAQPFSFLDDDNVATYNMANVADTQGFFAALTPQTVGSPIDGPRGGAFRFKIRPSLELQTSTFLFTKLGTTGNTWNGASGTYSYVDTIVKVTGATTGYSINVPVRYVKKD